MQLVNYVHVCVPRSGSVSRTALQGTLSFSVTIDNAENSDNITQMQVIATSPSAGETTVEFYAVRAMFCSLAVLDPRVGHTIDVLSPFTSVLCQSD